MDGVHRFNRNCRLISFLWLFTVIPVSECLRHSYQDFQAFYMAGVTARLGEWDALYPQRDRDSPYFIYSGFRWKPRQLELARQYGMEGTEPFIQLPWTAIAFVPLSMLGPRVAHALWIGVLIACTGAVSDFAGRCYAWSGGRPSRACGAITLIAAVSLLSYRAVRVGNVSPVVALTLAMAAYSLRQARDGPTAIATWAGCILKYATAILLPLMLAMRRWRCIGWLALAGMVTIAGTLQIAGVKTFADFFGNVAVTFRNSTPLPANQSVWGFVLRVTHLSTPPPSIRYAVVAIQMALFIWIVWLIFRGGRNAWQRGPALFAATAALVSWLLIFSPVFWEHYAVYLMPFWGWLAWEGNGSRLRATAGGLAIVLSWIPLPAILWLHLPEPLNSMMLWSTCLTLGLALYRLCRINVGACSATKPAEHL